MAYRESNLDRSCRQQFQKNNSQMLRAIRLHKGRLRGLTPFDLAFNFPITAIAGKNGSGKSTVLAMACCAFHAPDSGFKLSRRALPYYRFSDFFIQRAEENKAAEIAIYYAIAHDNWKKSPEVPTGIGIGLQLRGKKARGKWTDYDRRVARTVVFIGIERVVPHIERSQSRSYRSRFRASPINPWDEKVRQSVGRVLDKPYDAYQNLRHQRYSLPIVTVGETIYSGFNMGAGENALFEIFSVIYECGKNSLLVIDEIELGLHAEAQRRLIAELKQACLEQKCQIICTTHSKEIFDALPDDARVFMEARRGKTMVSPGVSAQFAFAKMGGADAHELEILIEDKVAKSIITNSLTTDLRTRLKLTPIGSAGALTRQLAASYVRKEQRGVLAIYDGEQRVLFKETIKTARGYAETKDAAFDAWFTEHAVFFPGDTWPEGWLIQKAREHVDLLADPLQTEKDVLLEALDAAQRAGKHNEFFTLAQALGFDDPATCLQIISSHVCKAEREELAPVVERVTHLLIE